MTALAGCVSPQQLALNDACDTSKEARTFPEKKSIAEITVRFDIELGKDQIRVNETVKCDYQGSFCPAGDWYDIWYGNQEIKRELSLPNEQAITIWHHGLCIELGDYKKQCLLGNCNPIDHFKFRLQLNSEETNRRKEECSKRDSGGVMNDIDQFLRCSFPEVELVTLEELKKYGYEINNKAIKVNKGG